MRPDLMQTRLAMHFDWFRNRCIPNVYFAGGECDLLVVTKARYATEIEIKCSLSDWNADRGKSKWAHVDRRYIKSFYYAVPTELIEKCPSWVPPTAGLIGITRRGGCDRVRVAKADKAALPLRPDTVAHLLSNIYFKHWRHRIGQSRGLLEPGQVPDAVTLEQAISLA
jgi:hypothetical protein